MRRVSVQEEIIKNQPVVKGAQVFCGLCGAEMEMDKESGEYLCPVCDSEEEEQ